MVSGIEGGRGYTQRWFDLAAEAWQDVRNVDCLLDGIQPVTSAMMLYSLGTQDEMAAQNRPTAFRQSMLGALELLTYTGRPVESIPDFRLSPEFLGRFDTLVLPEVEVLSDGQAEQIRDWVRQGGTLVATRPLRAAGRETHAARQFRPPRCPGRGLRFRGKQVRRELHRVGRPSAGGNARTGHRGVSRSLSHVKPTTATAVMRYRLPWMVEDLAKNKWYNWGPPPPGKETGGPAVTLHRFGKGQALYLAFPALSPVWGEASRPLDPRVGARVHPEVSPQPAHRASHPSAFGIRPRDLLLRQEPPVRAGAGPEYGAIGHRRRAASRAERGHSRRSIPDEDRCRPDGLAAATGLAAGRNATAGWLSPCRSWRSTPQSA